MLAYIAPADINGLAYAAPADVPAIEVTAPPSSGGGGPVREVSAYAKRFDDLDKPARKKATKAIKKAYRRALEDEALELLPPDVAPILARLAYQQPAPEWTPIDPLPPEAIAALVARAEAYKQQIALQEEIDDENVSELLLLG